MYVNRVRYEGFLEFCLSNHQLLYPRRQWLQTAGQHEHCKKKSVLATRISWKVLQVCMICCLNISAWMTSVVGRMNFFDLEETSATHFVTTFQNTFLLRKWCINVLSTHNNQHISNYLRSILEFPNKLGTRAQHLTLRFGPSVSRILKFEIFYWILYQQFVYQILIDRPF